MSKNNYVRTVTLAVTLVLTSCGLQGAHAQATNETENLLDQKTSDCLALRDEVRTIMEMKVNGTEFEVAFDVATQNPDIHDWQRWVIASYVYTVWTHDIKLTPSNYWGNFIGTCVQYMGTEALELEPSDTPAVDKSRRPV